MKLKRMTAALLLLAMLLACLPLGVLAAGCRARLKRKKPWISCLRKLRMRK